MLRTLSLFAILFLCATRVHAADYYVDPERGDPANDGSGEKPWRSLQEVFDTGLVESQAWDSLPHKHGSRLVRRNSGAPVKAGDTIWLRSGDYGDLIIQTWSRTATT